MGFKVEVGYKEKNRKKNILSSLRKLKESGDDVKINYVKTLYRYYCTINSLGYILYPKDIPVDDDKYGLHYLCSYLDGIVDTSNGLLLVLLKLLEMMNH